MLGQIPVPKKLCILRLSAIGDVCHAVAMVQYLQQQLPKTEITWVVGKIEAQLLADLPGVTLVVFDKSAGFKGYQSLWRQLKHQHFDVLLHMQVALRASLASLCIRATHKIGFDKQRAKEGQWLFTDHQVQAQQQPHVLDGFMAFAQALGFSGVSGKQVSWQMPLSDETLLWASEQFSDQQPFVVISPAASKAERNWLPERYARIAEYLHERGFHVVLTGGPTALERQLAEQIVAQSRITIENWVGKTSLKQLLAILKLARLVIAPDTGPAHMAVTVNTPVIGLYAHSNPQRTGPYLYRDYVVSVYEQAVLQQYQKPVDALPWGIRAKGEHLMAMISEEQVIQKIEQLLCDVYPELGNEAF
jgi:heptosyltransferase I